MADEQQGWLRPHISGFCQINRIASAKQIVTAVRPPKIIVAEPNPGGPDS
jgi:hypothetical protein